MESGKILLSGEGTNGSELYTSLKGIKSVLNYDDKDIENLQEIEAITCAVDILIERLQQYYGAEKSISKKEVLEDVELALEQFEVIYLIH